MTQKTGPVAAENSGTVINDILTLKTAIIFPNISVF